MVIKRRLWYAKAEGLTYYVVAKSFDEAVQLIKIWRPDAYIEEVRVSSSDSIVIVKEDMDEVIKERKGYEAH